MVSSTTYLKMSIKPSKSGLKEAILKDNWREKLVAPMIYPVVLKCCFCFLEHVLVSVLFLAPTSQSGSGKEHRGTLALPPCSSWSTRHRGVSSWVWSISREGGCPHLWAGCPSARSLHSKGVLPHVQMELPEHQLLPLSLALPCYINLYIFCFIV